MIIYGQPGVENPYVLPPGGSSFGETLYDMGVRLLELVKATFTGEGIPLPGREVVYMSPIPADCEQVAVLFTGWNPWPAAEGPTTCENFRWFADFSVIVTRCTPAVAPPNSKTLIPSPEKMKEAALLSSRDAEAFLLVLQNMGEFMTPSVIVQAPQGGMQTVEFNVSLPAGAV